RTKHPATVADLYATEGKAELVAGELITMSPTGFLPGYVADQIFGWLWLYEKQHDKGVAVGDNKGFRVTLPLRQSFSPDVASYTGPDTGVKFLEGAPIFAVEVRSEGDYGPTAEREMAAKR